MIIWIFFLLICYLLIGYYDKSKHKSCLLFLIIAILVYFATFRDGLGMDYSAYKDYCERERLYSVGWLLMEPIPAALYNFCYNTSFSAIVFFFVSALITCAASIWVYSRFNNFWLSAFIFITYTNLYLASFNLVRQFAASSLILLGTYLFVIKRKSPWFFLFLFMAFLWHKSAILAVFIYFLNDEKFHPTLWIFALLMSWFIPFDLIMKIPFLGNALEVLNYSDNLTHVGSAASAYSKTSISNLYMHFIAILLVLSRKKVACLTGEGKNGFYIALKLSIVSIIFCNISANSLPFAYRYAIFFSPFVPLAFSYLPYIFGKNAAKVMVFIPFFILLMTLLSLRIDDRIYCPERILPIESVFDKNYHPYENPNVILPQ